MATMGSFIRVDVSYGSLEEILRHQTLPVYGAFMEGKSLHEIHFGTEGGIIVIGNEANGISSKIESVINQRLTIPSFGGAESLNASMAAAIFCDNVRRQCKLA